VEKIITGWKNKNAEKDILMKEQETETDSTSGFEPQLSRDRLEETKLEKTKRLLEEKKEKLISMEKDLQKTSEKIEKKIEILSIKEENLNKRIKQLTSSEAFRRTQDLLDEIFTVASSQDISSEAVFESIRLIWDARSKFNIIDK
jgi:hypothetical protein